MSLFARLSPLLFSGTLMLILSDRAVPAQSPQPTSPSVETTSTPNQSSPLSAVTSSDQAPDPQRQPHPLRNYVGLGGSIGVSGRKTGLSEGGAALITKNDLDDALSIRGVSVFGRDRTDNTVALTINFPVRSRAGQVRLVPFVGGGALLSSRYNLKDFIVRGLVTGGVDVPLSRRFTATASVNVGFADITNIGVQVGAAYNF